MLTGLTQQTPYHVRVYRNCSNGTPEVATGMFTTSCYSSSDVEFTDGAATTYYIPVYNSSSYKYSYSQQIFLASELGGTPMDIKSIAFEYKYATALTSRSNVNIYLGHTTKSTFSSTTDWVPYSDLQLVYSGNLNCTMGWNTFVFNSVFHYNGTSNLVIVVDDNSNAASSTSYVFAYKTQSPNYRTMYHYNESTNPNPQSPPTASSRSYYRNNIKFFTVCDSTVTCYKPNAYISDRDHESIEVTWAPGGSESSWELEYKADNDVNWDRNEHYGELGSRQYGIRLADGIQHQRHHVDSGRLGDGSLHAVHADPQYGILYPFALGLRRWRLQLLDIGAGTHALRSGNPPADRRL